MPRIPDEFLQEIIDNDGYGVRGRKGSVTPINPTGVVRLCLDLQDARKELKDLKHALANMFYHEDEDDPGNPYNWCRWCDSSWDLGAEPTHDKNCHFHRSKG